MMRANRKKIIFTGIATAFVGACLYLLLSIQHTPQVIDKPSKLGTIKIGTSKLGTSKLGTSKLGSSKLISKTVSYPEEIEGKIITLKKLKLEHAFDYHNMFSDKVRKFMEFPKKLTFGEIEFQIRKELSDIAKNIMIVYTIWDNKDDRLVGSIQIREKSPDHPGQLAMWLNENYWGGGRIQEAMFLISKSYFDANPKVESYNAHVRLWNPRSIKSMEKFGFKKVGDFIENGKIERYIYELSRETIKQKSRN